MSLFPSGHATHPQWQMAVALVLAQLRAQMALPQYASQPQLGLLYITDAYADQAGPVLDALSAALPEVTDWVGAAGPGLCVNGAEYVAEPALAVMLLDVPVDQYRVFSGVAPLPQAASGRFAAHTALVHADGQLPELEDLVCEMAGRTQSGSVFGGACASAGAALQFAMASHGYLRGHGHASGVIRGGLSGVALAGGVPLLVRTSHGCRRLGAAHVITAVRDNVVLTLDHRPALEVLLATVDIPQVWNAESSMHKVQTTFAAMVPTPQPGSGGPAPAALDDGTPVRTIVGLDVRSRGVALSHPATLGQSLQFCTRDAAAVRNDLVRVCTEIREELSTAAESPLSASGSEGAALDGVTPRKIRGAIYISGVERGGAYFGAVGAELQIVRRALGDVPLVGFFASAEIAQQQVHRHAAVLAVFL